MTQHPLSSRTSRAVWFNSLLEALALSEDHVGYIQQLILIAISDGSPFLSTTIAPNQSIPQMLVDIAKGDNVNVLLHEEMYPILMVLQTKLKSLIKMVKSDPSLPLQLNLINIFANTLKDWMDNSIPLDQSIAQNGASETGSNFDQNAPNSEPITQFEYNQFRIIILAIASMNVFTQVNYSGLSIVLPWTLQQYRDNNPKVGPLPLSTQDSLDDIDDEPEPEPEPEPKPEQHSSGTHPHPDQLPVVSKTHKKSPSLQARVNLFFELFSPKAVSGTAGILELSKNAKNTKGKKWIQVEKAMLCNSALKLNGEDAYHCSHFPLFLIISRAVFGCEGALRSALSPVVSTVNSFQPSLTSLFAGEISNHLDFQYQSIANDQDSHPTAADGDDLLFKMAHLYSPNRGGRNVSLFGCPALLTWTLRALKLHSEILLTQTATIRTEFYTLALLYQLQYGILSSGNDFQHARGSVHGGAQVEAAGLVAVGGKGEEKGDVQGESQQQPDSAVVLQHETVCSEFKCIPFKQFHLAYFSNLPLENQQKLAGKRITNLFVTLFDTVSFFVQALNFVSFVDPLTGLDLRLSTKVVEAEDDFQPISNSGHVDFDAVLLLAYNHFANLSTTHTSAQTDLSAKNNTTNNNNNNNKSYSNSHHTTTSMESNVDDIHAVGISPLSHSHTHAHYKPIVLFPTHPVLTQTIPLTLATSIFTTITIELAAIALKLYLYKRSFLLLSLSKIFSGLSIFVSGILGRRTRYQSRSFAQLHGISFLNKDIIKAIEYDSRSSHLQLTTGLSFEQVSTLSTNSNSTTSTVSSTLTSTSAAPLDNQDDQDAPPALECLQIPPIFIISTDLSDTMLAPYIIKTDDADALIPKVTEETNEKFISEKERYKGVINERNPTIPRMSKLTFSGLIGEGGLDLERNVDENAMGVVNSKPKENFAVCFTRGGHVEDVPIDSIDDLYLTYMLPDQDNYNVDELTSKNLKNGEEILDFDPLGLAGETALPTVVEAEEGVQFDEKGEAIVKAGGTLEGIVSLLASSKGGLTFEANTATMDQDYTSTNQLKHVEPPLEQFVPYMQSGIGSVLTLAVAQYLYQTTPQTEITQQEQDCYLQTIFSHRFSQGNHYLDGGKNKYGQNYQEYSSLLDCQAYTTPYQAVTGSLMMRSVLEYTNLRQQVRAISQIELLTNLFITQDDNLATIHFQPNYLTDVVDMFHNIAIDSTTYDLSIRQVIKSQSPLMYLYNKNSKNIPHHQFQREHPEEYHQIITKTIRNLVRFRQNKVFTASSCPWWEILRTCADICQKTGFVTSSLRCYVNVQLWSMVIDTLIKIGRRGDATKLLKHVLRVPKGVDSNQMYLEFQENRRIELEMKRKRAEEEAAAAAAALALANANGGHSASVGADGSEGEFSVGFSDFSDQDDSKSSGQASSRISSRSSGMVPILQPMVPIMFQKSEFDLEISDNMGSSDETNENESENGKVKNKDDNQDSDYREGSLLHFVAKAMESTMYTTTTQSGLHTFSASSFRLYHLLGESLQDEFFWKIAWELSDQTYAPPQRALAKWLAVRKRNDEAYVCYQNALALNGSDHQTWYECGVVAIRLEQYNKAIPCFSNALRLKPDISEGWNNLAACHLYLQNIPSAYHALSQCLRSHSKSWKIWENFLQCSLQLEYYHDVLRALNHISQLKGKVDPMTLLPIQYTTTQSRFHVFALYMTWFQHLKNQIATQLKNCQNHQNQLLQGPQLPESPANNASESISTQHVSLPSCVLCVEPPESDPALAALLVSQHHHATWTFFPLIKTFIETIHSVLTNISHNESREAQMGGMMRGGGEDAGAGNSIAAQMDFANSLSHRSSAPSSQNDDDNAELIGDQGNEGNQDQDDEELIQQGKFLQVLSKTAKGQKIILHYLLGQAQSQVPIQSDLATMKQANTDFETAIDILIKLLIENSYSPSFLPHIDFLFTNLNHVINNATLLDDHILRHFRNYETEPLSDEDRHAANHKELVKLLIGRLKDGLKRDYDNNHRNLGHLVPYMERLQGLVDEVKALCDQDDGLFKEKGHQGSGQVAQAEDYYEYDPYGSFY